MFRNKSFGPAKCRDICGDTGTVRGRLIAAGYDYVLGRMFQDGIAKILHKGCFSFRKLRAAVNDHIPFHIRGSFHTMRAGLTLFWTAADLEEKLGTFEDYFHEFATHRLQVFAEWTHQSPAYARSGTSVLSGLQKF